MKPNHLLLYAYEKEFEILEDMSSGISRYRYEELFRVTKNLVHSLIDCQERIINDIKDKNHKSYFSAFRFVNNKLKHEKKLIDISEKADGITFPSKLDGSARSYHYVWSKNEKLGNSDKYKYQREAYKKILEMKPIIYTFRDIDAILKEYIE